MAIKVDTQKRSDLKRRSIYFSLRWKLLLGFTLIFSVVFAVAFYWFYQFATNAALNRIQDDLTSTLSGAAAGVNTDELLAVAHESQPNAAGQAWQAGSCFDCQRSHSNGRRQRTRFHGLPSSAQRRARSV